jgi:hypothetical protein
MNPRATAQSMLATEFTCFLRPRLSITQALWSAGDQVRAVEVFLDLYPHVQSRATWTWAKQPQTNVAFTKLRRWTRAVECLERQGNLRAYGFKACSRPEWGSSRIAASLHRFLSATYWMLLIPLPYIRLSPSPTFQRISSCSALVFQVDWLFNKNLRHFLGRFLFAAGSTLVLFTATDELLEWYPLQSRGRSDRDRWNASKALTSLRMASFGKLRR